jgi:hypothetical protein
VFCLATTVAIAKTGMSVRPPDPAITNDGVSYPVFGRIDGRCEKALNTTIQHATIANPERAGHVADGYLLHLVASCCWVQDNQTVAE